MATMVQMLRIYIAAPKNHYFHLDKYFSTYEYLRVVFIINELLGKGPPLDRSV